MRQLMKFTSYEKIPPWGGPPLTTEKTVVDG